MKKLHSQKEESMLVQYFTAIGQETNACSKLYDSSLREWWRYSTMRRCSQVLQKPGDVVIYFSVINYFRHRYLIAFWIHLCLLCAQQLFAKSNKFQISQFMSCLGKIKYQWERKLFHSPSCSFIESRIKPFGVILHITPSMPFRIEKNFNPFNKYFPRLLMRWRNGYYITSHWFLISDDWYMIFTWELTYLMFCDK